MNSVKFALNDKSEENSQYILECLQALVEYANSDKLAVVDCVVTDPSKYGELGEILPIVCAMLEDKAVLPLAMLFPKGSEPSQHFMPCFSKPDA